MRSGEGELATDPPSIIGGVSLRSSAPPCRRWKEKHELKNKHVPPRYDTHTVADDGAWVSRKRFLEPARGGGGGGGESDGDRERLKLLRVATAFHGGARRCRRPGSGEDTPGAGGVEVALALAEVTVPKRRSGDEDGDSVSGGVLAVAVLGLPRDEGLGALGALDGAFGALASSSGDDSEEELA